MTVRSRRGHQDLTPFLMNPKDLTPSLVNIIAKEADKKQADAVTASDLNHTRALSIELELPEKKAEVSEENQVFD